MSNNRKSCWGRVNIKNQAKIAKSMMIMLRVKDLVRKGVDSKKSRGKLSTEVEGSSTKGRQYYNCRNDKNVKFPKSKKSTLIKEKMRIFRL